MVRAHCRRRDCTDPVSMPPSKIFFLVFAAVFALISFTPRDLLIRAHLFFFFLSSFSSLSPLHSPQSTPTHTSHPMSALSASKQKRLAAKAAKDASKKSSSASTPAGTNGRNTPALPDNDDNEGSSLVPAMSAMDIAKKKGGDRTSTGVLTSQPLSRDIKIESFSLSFHGRELISNTDIDLNFGRRYGLIGANGSGKSTFLECLAAREVPIPEHIDVGTFVCKGFLLVLFLFLVFLLYFPMLGVGICQRTRKQTGQ